MAAAAISRWADAYAPTSSSGLHRQGAQQEADRGRWTYSPACYGTPKQIIRVIRCPDRMIGEHPMGTATKTNGWPHEVTCRPLQAIPATQGICSRRLGDARFG